MTLDVKRGFTRDEAAEYVGLSVYKIKNAIKRNELPAKRHGQDTIILREDLDMWVDSFEVA